MKNRIIISLFIAASLVFVGCGKTEGISKIGTEVSESSENAIREEFDTEVEFAEGTEEIGSTESTEVAEISNSGTSSNNSQGNVGTSGGSNSNNTSSKVQNNTGTSGGTTNGNTSGSTTVNTSSGNNNNSSSSTTANTTTNSTETEYVGCKHTEWFHCFREAGHYETVCTQEGYTETVSHEHKYFTCDTCGQRFETQNDIDAHFNEEAQKALEQSVATGQYVADHSGQTTHTETITEDVYHEPVYENVYVQDVEPFGGYQCCGCEKQHDEPIDYEGNAATVVEPPQWYKNAINPYYAGEWTW